MAKTKEEKAAYMKKWYAANIDKARAQARDGRRRFFEANPDRTLTADRLREVLHYEPESGVWTWIKPNSNSIKAGSIAGTIHPKTGYRQIRIDRKSYQSIRLAHLWMTGEWSLHDMDHIDRCRTNDKWSNIRPATRSQNTANRGIQSNNTSGFKGVSWNKRSRKWEARIRQNGKYKFLGNFDNPSDASAAYVAAGRETFGEFFCPNEILQAA
jgi:hypothetical protein